LQSEILGCHVGRHYFEEMSAVYSASRLVFNRSVADDVNMRVFEGLCSGSLLVTNDLADNGQSELFQDAKHLITYSSDEELLDKIRFYLKNGAARERIAAAGQEAAISKHTYRHRMQRIMEATSSHRSQVAVTKKRETSRLGEDPNYFAHARPELLALVSKTARAILDVGCGAGRLGLALKERQKCTVYGVEKQESAAKLAETRLDRVWTEDVESMELDLPPQSLDAIVCGDVLEHLKDPRQVLRRLSKLLKPDDYRRRRQRAA
jgi:hypothetical protein